VDYFTSAAAISFIHSHSAHFVHNLLQEFVHRSTFFKLHVHSGVYVKSFENQCLIFSLSSLLLLYRWKNLTCRTLPDLSSVVFMCCHYTCDDQTGNITEASASFIHSQRCCFILLRFSLIQSSFIDECVFLTTVTQMFPLHQVAAQRVSPLLSSPLCSPLLSSPLLSSLPSSPLLSSPLLSSPLLSSPLLSCVCPLNKTWQQQQPSSNNSRHSNAQHTGGKVRRK